MPDLPPPDSGTLGDLRRRCGLVLDLADEELQTRQRCAKDGHGEAQEVRDLGADVAAVRTSIQSLPDLLRLLTQAVADWPQFDRDDDVSGADMVEWYGQWRRNVMACLAKIDVMSDHSTRSPLRDTLGKGFVVLTYNAGNEVSSRYEAWAYEGPLDFDEAGPIRFGLGTDPHEAIDALNWQLQHNPDRPID